MIIALVLIVVAVVIIMAVVQESNKKNERAKDAAERAERIEKRRLALIREYGEEIGMKLFNQQFFIGMTKDQVEHSKGYPPDKKEREELKTKTKDTWIYGNKSSGDVFIFENDVLTKYKDR